jgi:L-ascorbate metabolism protein UlaG (beta-lactamase superfamily)
MRNLLKIFLIMLVLLYQSLLPQEITQTVDVIFVSNEGFLITCNSKKILIDALYTSGNPVAVSPSNDVIQKMENATSPFDSIDVICVTHNHADHFNMSSVGKHLENNKNAILVCPNSVLTSMKSYVNYNLIKERIIPVTASSGVKIEKEINGIPIKVLGFQHARPSIFPNLEHNGYLIDLDGVVILHCGDSWGENIAELESLKLKDEKIYIAFLHFDNFYNGALQQPQIGLDRTLQFIDPQNIIIMHNTPSYLDGGQQIIDSLINKFPNIFLFKNSLQEKYFSKKLTLINLEDKLLPESIKLYQNFPNPFNPSTEIRYSVKEAGNVLLKIYNSLGQEIITLVNKFQYPGEYIIKIKATGLASGIYLYRLQTGSFSQARKMLLSK